MVPRSVGQEPFSRHVIGGVPAPRLRFVAIRRYVGLVAHSLIRFSRFVTLHHLIPTTHNLTSPVPKDFYAVLGVSKSASPDEIKAAFRKLAHQHHPDKPTGNAEKFKEINEAYQVLSDADKRKQYDQFGSAAFDGSAGFGGGAQGFGGFDFSGFQNGQGFGDLGDMFGEMFGFGGRGGARREPRGNDVQVDVELEFRESVFGTDKSLSLTKFDSCERCGGVGAEPGTSLKDCADCQGKGVRLVTQRTILGTFQTKAECATCEGEGKIPEKKCSTCHGDGVVRAKKSLSVHVPAGVEDGNTLRVRGGGEGVRGGKPGDLYVRLHVKADKRFEREGATIYSGVDIGFTQAALGDTVTVETLDGDEKLTIPAGTQTGTEFRLRGHGVPTGSSRGDQVVIVRVVTPTKLSREQRKMLEDLNLKEE